MTKCEECCICCPPWWCAGNVWKVGRPVWGSRPLLAAAEPALIKADEKPRDYEPGGSSILGWYNNISAPDKSKEGKRQIPYCQIPSFRSRPPLNPEIWNPTPQLLRACTLCLKLSRAQSFAIHGVAELLASCRWIHQLYITASREDDLAEWKRFHGKSLIYSVEAWRLQRQTSQ